MSDTMTMQAPISAAPGVGALLEAANGLQEAAAALHPADGRWRTGGPLLSAAAVRLREAIGTPVVGVLGADAPPIVRQRDLAVAARRLFARDVQMQDAIAAGDFVALALDATVALSRTVADTCCEE